MLKDLLKYSSSLAKIKEQFEHYLQQEQQQIDDSGSSLDSSISCGSGQQHRELSAIWHYYIQLMDEINKVGSTLGKDGKFQLLICLSLRFVKIY